MKQSHKGLLPTPSGSAAHATVPAEVYPSPVESMLFELVVDCAEIVEDQRLSQQSSAHAAVPAEVYPFRPSPRSAVDCGCRSPGEVYPL